MGASIIVCAVGGLAFFAALGALMGPSFDWLERRANQWVVLFLAILTINGSLVGTIALIGLVLG